MSTYNIMQRTVYKIASSKPGAWLFSRLAHRLDEAVLRRTNNRKSLTSILTGTQVIIATTIGAKSGKPRSVPLLGLIKDQKVILVASNWGQSHYPNWYYNLIANPEVQLTIGQEVKSYIAREATQNEYDDYWEQVVEMYPGYVNYKKRAANRKIPLMVLSPNVAK